MSSRSIDGGARTFIDELLAEQQSLTAVDLFSRRKGPSTHNARQNLYRDLIPLEEPAAGRQYAFEVDLDKCSGCKACVSACHSLNGLEEGETWRSVGLLIGARKPGSTHSDPNKADEHLVGTSCCDISARVATGGTEALNPSLAPLNAAWTAQCAMPKSNPPRQLECHELHVPLVQHVTTACHHCVDPGCLNGCPVLAYEKDPVTGIVRHLDDQCMGCTYCVMKCPYEVPQYSKRLGIVRKCDMCSHRLADGEAPAGVQACPDQAIRITVIDQVEAAVTASESWNSLVAAGSPDPAITLPTTRFVSDRGFSVAVQAADLGAVRLDHAHWPLVIMLVCTQAATGMFLAAAIARSTLPGVEVRALTLTAFGLLMAGLTVSVLHLGRPLRAWRSFLGWRKSWLSREIMAFGGFGAVAVLAVSAGMFPSVKIGFEIRAGLTLAAALAGLTGVFASAMVYVDTHRPFWSPRFVFGNFLGTTVLLGAAAAAALFEQTAVNGQVTQLNTMAAVVAVTVLFVWRRLELRFALRNPASAIHFNARVIHELLPWLMRLQPVLFLLITVSALPAITKTARTAESWGVVLALASLFSEIAWRYAFFAAGGSRRMPGGIVG